MPLSKGTGSAAREENVKREIAAGKDPKQAVAIAYSQQRKNKASDSMKPMIKSLITKINRIIGIANK